MPEPSALRYLSTLVSRGLLEREGKGEQGRYRLGVGLFVLAEQAVGNLDMRVLALPHMRWLVERYEETVYLAVFRQARLVIIEVLEGTRSIRQEARVGQQEQLRSTALGKAILATCSDDEALSLLSLEVLEKSTPRTIHTDEGMLRELRAIRSRGYAVDNEEHEIGLRCVAVAIPYRGQSFGLSMSGPSHLFSREVVREVGASLVSRRCRARHSGQLLAQCWTCAAQLKPRFTGTEGVRAQAVPSSCHSGGPTEPAGDTDDTPAP